MFGSDDCIGVRVNGNVIQQAIHYAQAGRKADALRLLNEVLRIDRSNETAWLWYADCLETHEERVQALEACLRLNPNAIRARAGLRALRQEEYRSHHPDVGRTQPIFLHRDSPEGNPPSPISVTTGDQDGPTEEAAPEFQKGAPSPDLSAQNEWVFSPGYSVFTVSPELITPEEFDREEENAQAFLLTQPTPRQEQSTDPWEQIARPAGAGQERRTLPLNQLEQRRRREKLFTIVTAVILLIMIVLLVGAVILLRGV